MTPNQASDAIDSLKLARKDGMNDREYYARLRVLRSYLFASKNTVSTGKIDSK